jgi:hypothetical protein
MASGADSDERFAGIEVRSHCIQLLFERSAPAQTDEEEVRIAERRDQPREIIFVLSVGVNDRHAKAGWLQFRFGELREGFPGFVFVLADHEDNVGIGFWFSRQRRRAEQQ